MIIALFTICMNTHVITELIDYLK